MKGASVWQLLEIEPTFDSKAIRRAYAAKLRGIDPDKDRETFSSLREARDRALAIAAQADDSGKRSDTSSHVAASECAISIILPCPPMPIAAPSLQARYDRVGTVQAALPDDETEWRMPSIAPGFRREDTGTCANELALPDCSGALEPPRLIGQTGLDMRRPDQKLYALLYPDPNDEANATPMTQGEITDAMGHLGDIHDDAQTGAIDMHARIEDWLSNILAGSWPRSYPLMQATSDLFGWGAREGQLGVAPAIDYINQRLASVRFSEAVAQAWHPLNGAWRQLSKPTRAGQSRALWWQGEKIDELLATIRSTHPELESQLNWHRIAMWEERRARPFPWWATAVGVIFCLQILVRIAITVAQPDATSNNPVVEQAALAPLVAEVPRVPGGLGEVDADIKVAIQTTLGPGVTADVLRSQAPLILQLFESNWRIGLNSRQTRTQYIGVMAMIMRERYVDLARTSSAGDLIALQRQRLSEEKSLKADHWKECARVIEHGGLVDPQILSPDLRDAHRDDMARLILAKPSNPGRVAFGGEFTISGPMVEGILRSSGLTLDQVTAAFRRKGTDREKCLTHIALLETVLAADAKTRAEMINHI